MEGKTKGTGARSPRGGRDEDGNENKLYPYSIRATIRSIREYWMGHASNRVLNVEEFVNATQPILELLYEKYRKHKKVNQRALIERLERMDQDITYFDLRYFAECVKVPSAILYIFTHLVGDVARDASKERALNLLDGTVSAITALRAYVAAVPDGNQKALRNAFMIIHRPDDVNSTYDSRLDGLRIASEAYRPYIQESDKLIG